jgi:hypothetical protein
MPTREPRNLTPPIAAKPTKWIAVGADRAPLHLLRPTVVCDRRLPRRWRADPLAGGGLRRLPYRLRDAALQ